MNSYDPQSDHSSEEMPFADGNVSGTVRVGETVRRSAGPWTPAVHAFLSHLRDHGFSGAPDALGMDATGREVLSFIPGETAPASLDGFDDDATLDAIARLYRSFHAAAQGFTPPPNAVWRVTVGAPTSGEIVCHNDLAPWNTVFAAGVPVALIDWDFATPAAVSWDIAYALWRWVPLYADDRYGPPSERARRIRLFCDAYGWDDPVSLLPIIAQRQRVLCDTLVTWGETGMPGFAQMLADGHREIIDRDIVYLAQHAPAIESALWDR